MVAAMSSDTVPFLTDGMRFFGPKKRASFGVITGRSEGVEKTLVGCNSPARTYSMHEI